MKTILLSTCALALLPLAAFAQTAPEADVGGRAGADSLDKVVVTAARSPQAAETVGASVTVLDQSYIIASQRIAVAELLQEVPGVNFTRNGGPGTSTTVNIRGAEGHHTVALIDGVKLNDPSSTQGAFNFGNLLVGDVARIEVLRGGQSTLWGSQAVGGVVNIVTREPQAAFEASADVEGGSRGTAYGRLGAGGKTERIDWRIAGSYYTTDGYSAYAGANEKDGYQNNGLAGRLRVKLTDEVSVEARSVWSKGKVDFDAYNGDSPEYGDTEELVAYVGLNAALLDGRFNNRLAYAYTDTDRQNYNPATPAAPLTFDAQGKNRRVEYQGTFAVSDTVSAVFGAEHERSRMTTRAPGPWDPNPPTEGGKVGVDAVYGQVQATLVPGLTLTGGLRYEDHDAYGDKTLGSVAGAWALNDGATVLRASWSQGFRAPGLYELYSQYGNAALKAESFDTWDAGVQQFFDGGFVSATYFHRRSDNEIRYNSCFDGADPLCVVNGQMRYGYYRNLQKTQAQGVEVALQAALTPSLVLNANYTLTDAENRSGANAGRQLSRRPMNTAFAALTYAWGNGLTTTAAARFTDRSFNNEANTSYLDGYTLVDLRAAYPLNDKIEVYGRIENLFDTSYQLVQGYGVAGRGAFAGVRARF